jgi:DNA polymerase I-like protein with 3'-5' exonuclease and polymerase domains
VVDLVLEHRTLSKLRSTYLEPLLNQVSPTTGAAHLESLHC